MRLDRLTRSRLRQLWPGPGTLRNLVGEFGESRIGWRTVDVLEELDHAVALGVLATPAISIDGQLRFTGLPSIRELHAEFTRRFAAKGGAEVENQMKALETLHREPMLLGNSRN
jgi:hypothetical protein